jgi:putative membrane protein insertion efficiency factor
LAVLGFNAHRLARSGSIFDGRRVVAGGIHVYQRSLSPLAARVGIRCRFTPTCSRYAETVIQRDGVLRGGWLAVKRVARCGPWTTPGTIDEP